MFPTRLVVLFLMLCGTVFAQQGGVYYDATHILGFGPEGLGEPPVPAKNQVWIRYGGWSFGELREKIRLEKLKDYETDPATDERVSIDGADPYFKHVKDERMVRGFYCLTVHQDDVDWRSIRLTFKGEPAPVVLAATAAIVHFQQTGRDLFSGLPLTDDASDARTAIGNVGKELIKAQQEEYPPRFTVCKELYEGGRIRLSWTGNQLNLLTTCGMAVQDARQISYLLGLNLTEEEINKIGPPPRDERELQAIIYDPGWSIMKMSKVLNDEKRNKAMPIRYSDLAVVTYDEKDEGDWLTRTEEPGYRRLKWVAGRGGWTFADQYSQLKKGEDPVPARQVFLAIAALKSQGLFILGHFDVRTDDVLPDGRRIVVKHWGQNVRIDAYHDSISLDNLTLGAVVKKK